MSSSSFFINYGLRLNVVQKHHHHHHHHHLFSSLMSFVKGVIQIHNSLNNPASVFVLVLLARALMSWDEPELIRAPFVSLSRSKFSFRKRDPIWCFGWLPNACGFCSLLNVDIHRPVSYDGEYPLRCIDALPLLGDELCSWHDVGGGGVVWFFVIIICRSKSIPKQQRVDRS